MTKKIILASASPQRRELLKQIGLSFSILPCSASEKMNPRLKPRSQAEHLSLQKAQTIAENQKNALVIAADTIVVMHDEILGKPHTVTEARKMLTKLQGKMHMVITGFTVIDTESKKKITKSVVTKLWMRKLTQKEIENYIKQQKRLDTAGAYAINNLGAVLFEKIEGDFYNIVGLPLFELTKTLKKFDLNIL